MHRMRYIWIAVLLIIMLMGCSLKKAEYVQPVEGVITVMDYNYWDFMQNYGGDAFTALHPGVKFEVIPPDGAEMNPDDMMNFIETHSPDVMILWSYQYARLVRENKLLALDALASRDKYDIEALYEGAVELLRQQGNGELFGLVPTFYSSALVYNRDLFDQYNVPYPAGGMTWDEIAELASRFPVSEDIEERVYGFETGNSLWRWVENLGYRYYGLSAFDTEQHQVTLDTPQWRLVWTQAVRDYQSGVYHFPELLPADDYVKKNAFYQGKAAMTVIPSYDIAARLLDGPGGEKKVQFQWEAVAQPIHVDDAGQNATIDLFRVYAINRQAANSEQAWAFLKYIASESYAQFLQPRQNGMLSLREGSTRSIGGLETEIFYEPREAGVLTTSHAFELPHEFNARYNELLQAELDAVISGEITVEQALTSLQAKVEVTYNQLVTAELP